MKGVQTESIPLTRLTVPVARRDHIQGRLDAPVTLLEYGDYECPACGQVFPMVKAVQERLGDGLCFAFRHFPLTNVHPHSEHAAEAAEGAGAQGKFWMMHDALFENQDALEDEDLIRYATALRLNARRLITEVQTGAYVTRLREDFMSGIRGGVNGTPTFFINGTRYDGARALSDLLNAAALRL
ncbi:MAG TPA: DsbA family protein [Chthoniobacterales bacterium]|jgi:protein-disulfide isomerase|nr:DsbA family protein [Chthoniobacterales bacterium]